MKVTVREADSDEGGCMGCRHRDKVWLAEYEGLGAYTHAVRLCEPCMEIFVRALVNRSGIFERDR